MNQREPFGITVKQTPEKAATPQLNIPAKPAGWAVYLPHQCDTWDIAGEANWDEGVSQDEAIAALERFVQEAHDALAALRAGNAYGEQDDW